MREDIGVLRARQRPWFVLRHRGAHPLEQIVQRHTFPIAVERIAGERRRHLHSAERFTMTRGAVVGVELLTARRLLSGVDLIPRCFLSLRRDETESGRDNY